MARILLLDDDIAEITAVKRLVARTAHRAQLATTAADASGAIERDPPDLLLVASRCDGGQALSVVREAAARRETSALPVIVLGDADGLSGPVSALALPIDPEQLGREIERLLAASSVAPIAPIAPTARPRAHAGAAEALRARATELRGATGPARRGIEAPRAPAVEALNGRADGAEDPRGWADELAGLGAELGAPEAAPLPDPGRSAAAERAAVEVRRAAAAAAVERRAATERREAPVGRPRADEEARRRAEAEEEERLRAAIASARAELEVMRRRQAPAAQARRAPEAPASSPSPSDPSPPSAASRPAPPAPATPTGPAGPALTGRKPTAPKPAAPRSDEPALAVPKLAVRESAVLESAVLESAATGGAAPRRAAPERPAPEGAAPTAAEPGTTAPGFTDPRPAAPTRTSPVLTSATTAAPGLATPEPTAELGVSERDAQKIAAREFTATSLPSPAPAAPAPDAPEPASPELATQTGAAPGAAAPEPAAPKPAAPKPAAPAPAAPTLDTPTPPASEPAAPGPAATKPAPASLASPAPPRVTPPPVMPSLPPPPEELRAGTLGELPAPRLLALAAQVRMAGRLDLEGEVARSLWFEGGRVVGATSGDPAERIEALAVRLGLVTRDQHQQVAAQAASLPARRAALLLLDAGFLKPAELGGLVRRRTEEVVFGIFGDAGARFRWTADEVPADERGAVERPPLALAVEGVRRRWSAPRLDPVLGGPDTLLSSVPDGPPPDALALSPEERQVVALSDGLRTVHEIERASPLDALATRQVLVALVQVGALEVRRLAIRVSPEATREIDLARLADKLDQARRCDYFTVLGLSRSSTSHEVREAASRLEEALEPGRLAGTPGETLASLGELLQVVRDAREVLGDDRLREAYLSALGA